MNKMKSKILKCKTTKELNDLRLELLRDRENFNENQKLFIKQKNKIKYGNPNVEIIYEYVVSNE